MTWIKLDDTFPMHPKVIKAGPDAAWLYVASVCHAGHFLTDGFVDLDVVKSLTRLRQVSRCVSALVDVGLWDEVDGGYQIHDYSNHQKSKESVEKQRVANRERQAKFKQRLNEGNAVTNAVTNAEVTQPDTDTDTETMCYPPNPPQKRGGRTADKSSSRAGSRAGEN